MVAGNRVETRHFLSNTNLFAGQALRHVLWFLATLQSFLHILRQCRVRRVQLTLLFDEEIACNLASVV